MSEERIHKVFWYISRATIIIPLVVIVLTFIIKVDQVKQSRRTKRTQANAASQTPTPTPQQDNSAVSIDLSISQICTFDTESGSSGMISISPEAVAATIHRNTNDKAETRRGLYVDDCAYTWLEGELKGVKKCGIGKMVQVMRTMSAMGLLDVRSILETLGKVDEVQEAEIEKPTAFACTPQEIAPEVFAKDPTVRFEER